MQRKGRFAIFRLILLNAGLPAAIVIANLSLVPGVSAQSDEMSELAVKDAVTRYYSGFDKRDLRWLAEFWEPDSVGLPEAQDELAAAFGRIGSVRLKGIEFQKVGLDADAANIALKVELYAFEYGTGRRVFAFGSGNRIVTLRRSGQKWLITSDQPAERLLAKRIADARDGDERSRLLSEDRRLENDFTGAEIIEFGRIDREKAVGLSECKGRFGWSTVVESKGV